MPLLLASDIGGTHARFMLVRSEGEALYPLVEATLAVADHATLEDAGAAFLSSQGKVRVDRACLAVAGPIEGRRARLTNAAWRIDADRFAAALGIAHVRLHNDFEAAASGIGELDRSGLVSIQEAPPTEDGMRVVIGAGTGLGVAYLLPGRPSARIIAGEGGHAAFAPANDRQMDLRAFIARETVRVTNEHVLSGAGLVRLYAFASKASELPDEVRSDGAAAVSRRARSGDRAAADALRLFVEVFGSVAGDHALSVLATGGVFIAGGIAPRLADRFASNEFLSAFRDKAGHAALMRRMPVALVRDARLGLLGAARLALT
ncbi:MAG TPA: glucokinase [Casimicrobiaceae bacterium]|nr:glucokinase [Casimicrobiaceae bacterium]